MKRVLSMAVIIVLLFSLQTAAQPLPFGDINGDGAVSLSDAMLLFKAVAGKGEVSLDTADLDFDGSITISDAMLIFKNIAGKGSLLNEENITTINVSQTANKHRLDGIGVEWNPVMFTNDPSVPVEETKELITRRLDILNVQAFRFMVQPQWYEPQNDNNNVKVIDWESLNIENSTDISWQTLIFQLDYAQAHNAKVNLALWGCPRGTWLWFEGVGDWQSAPNDIDEYAENVSILLQYLIVKKGYTCIKDFTIQNEPDWSYYVPAGVNSFDYYVQTCKAVDARLKEDGIRDKINLALSDDTENYNWFEYTLRDLSEISDVYSIHTYKLNQSDPMRTIDVWSGERKLALTKYKQLDKRWVVNEFGTADQNTYGSESIDSYDRGIFFAKFIISYLNNGAAGVLHWELTDTMYGELSNCGLFHYYSEGYEIKPAYHALGLIMNHTKRNSEIYPAKSIEYINDTTNLLKNYKLGATAFKSEAGEWSYLVVNTDNTARTVKIVNQNTTNVNLNVYEYSESTVTKGEALPSASSKPMTASGGEIYLTIEPNTFVIISEF